MSEETRDRFITYYTNEMNYLRQAGHAFSQTHPKIARRLELSDKESPDPHTERLLESFAFLTARLAQEIDNRFPESAAALLQVLYPHLVNPIPSMSVAQFHTDPSKGKITKSHTIKKGSSLFCYASGDIMCRFQTAYPVTLLPLELISANVIQRSYLPSSKHGWYLKLTLKTHGGIAINDIDLDDLTVHISAQRHVAYAIYESLFSQKEKHIFASIPNEEHIIELTKNSINPMGFSEDEMMLPTPPHGTNAFLLLQEFFHLPEKFMFFKITNLKKIIETQLFISDTLDLYISLGHIGSLLDYKINKDNFLLGCSPIINLFKKTTDPLRLDRRKIRYRLIPDQRRDNTLEFYSIESVMSSVESSDQVQTFAPYFSLQHHNDENQIFWHTKRIASEIRGVPGSDIMISFVDLKFNPTLPPRNIVYANTLCTNRYLAEQIPGQTELQLEEAAPTSHITCLYKPTAQSYAPIDGDSLWRMISILSVNHLTLMNSESSLDTLKERLFLHVGTSQKDKLKDIASIIGISHKQIVRRIGNEAWRGFVKGIEVTIQFDTTPQKGASSFLLSSILRHYFSITVSMNSFVELVLKGTEREGEWMRWPALLGTKTLL
ncbi:MAG: type VI secretion system baseplate subunit TssF [Candidatus Paracaedibacteraceae bacterium]|nr:type VI secretion system baseplate subunit TssF [Candidatus Paracaedibacteraceae bacterium]